MLSSISSLAADYVVIDTPAKAADMAAAVIRVAPTALVVIQPSSADIWACAPTVKMIQSKLDIGGKIDAAFLVNRTKPNTKLSKLVNGQAAEGERCRQDRRLLEGPGQVIHPGRVNRGPPPHAPRRGVLPSNRGAEKRQEAQGRSKSIAGMFQSVVEAYQVEEEGDDDTPSGLTCHAEHVDGGMNASQKETKRNWLNAETPDNTCPHPEQRARSVRRRGCAGARCGGFPDPAQRPGKSAATSSCP